MNERAVLILLAALGLTATAICLRYLPRDLQVLVAIAGLMGAIHTLTGSAA